MQDLGAYIDIYTNTIYTFGKYEKHKSLSIFVFLFDSNI